MAKVETLKASQVASLLANGSMNREAADRLQESGAISMGLRKPKTDNEIVLAVHSQIVDLFNRNCLDLAEAGFRPAIVWNKLKVEEEDETEPEIGPGTDPF